MNHVWEYINAYNESTFDQLEHELLSREYEYVRKCPNYEDCLSFCNSMNALNSSMDKITPQSKFVNKHIESIKRLVFEVHHHSFEKQQMDVYEVRVMIELNNSENKNPLTFDKFYFKVSDIDEKESLDEGLLINIYDYMHEYGLKCKYDLKIIN